MYIFVAENSNRLLVRKRHQKKRVEGNQTKRYNIILLVSHVGQRYLRSEHSETKSLIISILTRHSLTNPENCHNF